MKTVYLLIVLLIPVFLQAQDNSSGFYYNGNIRFAHLGSDTDGSGLGGDNTSMRFRFGAGYAFNQNHAIYGRVATTISQDFEHVRFNMRADGGGMNYGSVTFDNLHYRFSNENTMLKVGRFQETIDVLSNARRSHLRFQSNVNFIHFSDGLHLKQALGDNWFGETIIEYQPRGHTTYPYRSPLDFGANEQNITSYFGLETRERDKLNFIQKGIGMLYIPEAYFRNGAYTYYLALSSRAVLDVPSRDLLNGGSFRIAGELGQNLNADFENGTSMVISAGVNGVAERHEFMVEFARTDSEWLTATVYGPDSDEVEFRYRFFVNSSLNFDFRYRIRDSRVDTVPTAYSTFLRATVSF